MHIDNHSSPHALLKTLPLKSVAVTSGFWSARQGINRAASLKTGYQRLEEAGNFHDLRLAAGLASGEFRGPLFMDSDVYKWLEAVGYDLAFHQDEELLGMANRAIQLVASAQAPDGYLNSYVQVVNPAGRWADLDHGHEMYCIGHLIQAAIAFHRGTGETRLLEVACRAADHIDAVFGVGKKEGTCGHPEIEMALVELYRETGQERYLQLSGFLIDQRGKGKMHGLWPFGPEYHQDRVPIRKAQVVEGHAVRQLYLTSGVTDYVMESGDEELMAAMRRLWHDLTARKTHITGGFGARATGEAFGEAYELPSETCYCETCAAIAGLMWNWRMLLATGEERFASLMERSLYNGILSGVSLDGLRYFYVNPLMTRGGHNRVEWFGCACCPPNLMRLVASISQFAFTQDANGVQLHHYMSARASFDHPAAGPLALDMQADFPFDSLVKVVIQQTNGNEWDLRLRIPDWCPDARVRVNTREVEIPQAGSYFNLRRPWKAGDKVDLVLPLTPRLVAPNPRVNDLRGSLAIQRGPLIYCIESTDLPAGVDILDVGIQPSAPLRSTWLDNLLGGIAVVELEGWAQEAKNWANDLYLPASAASTGGMPVKLTAVPYFAWNNRGDGAMRVWLPAKDG